MTILGLNTKGGSYPAHRPEGFPGNERVIEVPERHPGVEVRLLPLSRRRRPAPRSQVPTSLPETVKAPGIDVPQPRGILAGSPR